MLGSFFFLRSVILVRLLPFAFVVWAVLISLHAIYLYMSEQGQRAAEEAIEEAEARAEMRKRKREEEALLEEDYVIGPDGELRDLEEEQRQNGYH
jgi:hypothetical protein